MKKAKWTNRLICWGGNTVLPAVCYIATLIGCACYYIARFKPAWWGKLTASIKTRFKKNTRKE